MYYLIWTSFDHTNLAITQSITSFDEVVSISHSWTMLAVQRRIRLNQPGDHWAHRWTEIHSEMIEEEKLVRIIVERPDGTGYSRYVFGNEEGVFAIWRKIRTIELHWTNVYLELIEPEILPPILI